MNVTSDRRHVEIQDYKLIQGDCVVKLKSMTCNSVDAIVTDPPYGINFMGKIWDYELPEIGIWKECLRVLKPGGHMLVACGTRTQHRMAGRIEDAGFEVRDIVSWVYGSGFPKSLHVGKAVDQLLGNERKVVGEKTVHDIRGGALLEATDPALRKDKSKIIVQITRGTSKWEGWGTALKPAQEMWTLFRKPLDCATVRDNVLKWGVGAINIEACRIGRMKRYNSYASNGSIIGMGTEGSMSSDGGSEVEGRYPANFIHDGLSEDWAKYFYCAKPTKKERSAGLAGMENTHPTVKPLKLMRYLCRLITPGGGLALDPFMGSGTTGVACAKEDFRFMGMERDELYMELARRRISTAYRELNL